MCPKRRTAALAQGPGRQLGFSLPVAILVIVLLSLLGAAMIALTSTGHRSVSAQVIGTRAFYAAQSGAQYGLSRLFPLNGGGATCSATSVNFTVPGLRGCSANIACTGPVTLNRHNFFKLTSTGRCGSGDNQATRIVQVGARSP